MKVYSLDLWQTGFYGGSSFRYYKIPDFTEFGALSVGLSMGVSSLLSSPPCCVIYVPTCLNFYIAQHLQLIYRSV